MAPRENADDPVELTLTGRERDLGGFSVRRVLPSAQRRLIGPFIFFDVLGPATFPAGRGIDVRPHPHIALATITYLFEGEILHRDSLGSVEPIRAGDVNWMMAGHGIVHSERTSAEVRAQASRIHGLQTWVALPTSQEESEPRFEHHAASSLPVVKRPGAELRVVAGSAYGVTAPTGVLSPTLYVHARLEAGATLEVDEGHEERAVFAVSGEFECAGHPLPVGTMLVVRPGARAALRAIQGGDVMLVGGAPLDGPRHLYWNFVSSDPARIERAKADWREGRFPLVPGDSEERIPLPEG
jgi:redox-sensitive bicupin YhaK (pirin superfamily)